MAKNHGEADGLSTMDWIALILANAPAGVATLVQLKNLFGTTYHELVSEFGSDVPLDELREKLKMKLEAMRAESEEIQKID